MLNISKSKVQDRDKIKDYIKCSFLKPVDQNRNPDNLYIYKIARSAYIEYQSGRKLVDNRCSDCQFFKTTSAVNDRTLRGQHVQLMNSYDLFIA